MDRVNFWKGRPHEPLEVEATFRAFVQEFGGTVLDDLPTPSGQQTADFVFGHENLVGELKEIRTAFERAENVQRSLESLLYRLELSADVGFRIYGDDVLFPPWFVEGVTRLFRPQISRILKKANNQLKASKQQHAPHGSGVVFFVNDEFTGLPPHLLLALIEELLSHSYSSIDCVVYLTVNRYLEIPGSDTPRLAWMPVYRNDASYNLVQVIDRLGYRWFKFLETKIGPFTCKDWRSSDIERVINARPIILPEDTPSSRRDSDPFTRGIWMLP
jgi:hypothetical protein